MWSPGLERVLLSEKIGIPSDFLPRFNMFPVVHPRRNCSMETGMRRCTDNIPRCKQWWQELWSWWNDIDIYWHTLAFLKHHWAQLLKWPHFQTSKGWTQSIRGQETALSYLLGNSQHQNLNIVCAVLHIWHISGSLTCFHLSSGVYPSHPKSTVKCCSNKICKADETRAVPKDSSPRASFSGMPRWLALTSGRKKNHRLGHGTKQQTIANHLDLGANVSRYVVGA